MVGGLPTPAEQQAEALKNANNASNVIHQKTAGLPSEIAVVINNTANQLSTNIENVVDNTEAEAEQKKNNEEAAKDTADAQKITAAKREARDNGGPAAPGAAPVDQAAPVDKAAPGGPGAAEPAEPAAPGAAPGAAPVPPPAAAEAPKKGNGGGYIQSGGTISDNIEALKKLDAFIDEEKSKSKGNKFSVELNKQLNVIKQDINNLLEDQKAAAKAAAASGSEPPPPAKKENEPTEENISSNITKLKELKASLEKERNKLSDTNHDKYNSKLVVGLNNILNKIIDEIEDQEAAGDALKEAKKKTANKEKSKSIGNTINCPGRFKAYDKEYDNDGGRKRSISKSKSKQSRSKRKSKRSGSKRSGSKRSGSNSNSKSNSKSKRRGTKRKRT